MFTAMSASERSESIKKAGLCFNCFRSNHKVSECKAISCKRYSRKHNSMLHTDKESYMSTITEAEAEKDTQKMQ